jgi:macrolide phosphotransferase
MMSRTKEEVLEIAQKYKLNLQEDSLVFNESGIDFFVAFAKTEDGEDWVLRFPRRPDVMIETEQEKKILDLVNRQVQFETPNWEIYNEEMIAYKKLSGIPMGTINVEIQNYEYAMDLNNIPSVFYESTGRLLASLHSISMDQIAAANLQVIDGIQAREKMAQRMTKVKEIYGVGENLWSRWQTWLATDELWPIKTGFVHGDFHPGHIMINEQVETIGLIDWTEGHVDDVAVDFTTIYKIIGDEALDRLISAYEEAGGYTWPKMKEHIIELTATWPLFIAEFALKSGMKEYEAYAQEMLEL